MVYKVRKQIILNWDFARELGQIHASKRNLGYGQEVDNRLLVNKDMKKWKSMMIGKMRGQKTGSINELVE